MPNDFGNGMGSSSHPDPRATTAAVVGASETDYRARVQRIYQRYSPDSLDILDRILDRYKGQETLLIRRLVEKYGPEPTSGNLKAAPSGPVTDQHLSRLTRYRSTDSYASTTMSTVTEKPHYNPTLYGNRGLVAVPEEKPRVAEAVDPRTQSVPGSCESCGWRGTSTEYFNHHIHHCPGAAREVKREVQEGTFTDEIDKRFRLETTAGKHRNDSHKLVPLIGIILAWWFGLCYGLSIFNAIAFVGGISLYVIWHRRSCQQWDLRRDAMVIHSVLECGPQVLTSVIPKATQRWLAFPPTGHAERTLWFDRLLASLWPSISAATARSIVDSLNPTLKNSCPAFLSKLECGHVSMGLDPIRFTSAKVNPMSKAQGGGTEIVFELAWNSSCDIAVLAGAKLVDVEAHVKNLRLQGTLSLVLGPVLNNWPCAYALAMSFLSPPAMSFDLKAAKVPLTAIPGFQDWLDKFLRSIMTNLMVNPKRLVIPITKVPPEVQPRLMPVVPPRGAVVVEIRSAEKLTSDALRGAPTTYVQGRIVPEPAGQIIKYCTRKISDDCSPHYYDPTDTKQPTSEYTFTFPVYHLPDEKIVLEVVNKERSIGSVRDVVQGDGKTRLGVVHLPIRPIVERERALSKHLMESNPQFYFDYMTANSQAAAKPQAYPLQKYIMHDDDPD